MQTQPYAMCFCGSGWKSSVHTCTSSFVLWTNKCRHTAHRFALTPSNHRLILSTARVERYLQYWQPSNPWCLHRPYFYFRDPSKVNRRKTRTAASPEVRLQRTKLKSRSTLCEPRRSYDFNHSAASAAPFLYLLTGISELDLE
jgi:hypothetical protein